jgi:hypothetical protein
MEANLTSAAVIIRVKFCEGRYGGAFHGGGLQPLGAWFPEYLNSLTSCFIVFVGLHMLLFNQHDSQLLKVVAAHFALNGMASFLYHWTGYDSALTIDGYTMMNAAWLSCGFVLEEITSFMVIGGCATRQQGGLTHAMLNGASQPRRVLRRVLRTLYWLLVCFVPAAFLLALEPPWRSQVGDISTLFIAAFALPILLMLLLNLVLMRKGIEHATLQHFPALADGVRTLADARRRFFVGLVLVLLGVFAWVLAEGFCDRYDAFKLFPGHAIFHVLMALGLMQCLVYPSILRAASFGSHPRFLVESDWLQPSNSLSGGNGERAARSADESATGTADHRTDGERLRGGGGGPEHAPSGHSSDDGASPPGMARRRVARAAREGCRRVARAYLLCFPAITFVRAEGYQDIPILHEQESGGRAHAKRAPESSRNHQEEPPPPHQHAGTGQRDSQPVVSPSPLPPPCAEVSVVQAV